MMVMVMVTVTEMVMVTVVVTVMVITVTVMVTVAVMVAVMVTVMVVVMEMVTVVAAPHRLRRSPVCTWGLPAGSVCPRAPHDWLLPVPQVWGQDVAGPPGAPPAGELRAPHIRSTRGGLLHTRSRAACVQRPGWGQAQGAIEPVQGGARRG